MSNKMPPVPPANRSDKGPGDQPTVAKDDPKPAAVPNNLEDQDQQGNTKQNTTNQGYQQDR